MGRLKLIYHIRQPALWIITTLSGGQLYEVWALPFQGQGIPLIQAYYDQKRRRSSKYHFYFFFKIIGNILLAPTLF